ncbi:LppA family lipoprotein [Amycolatopsis orientalis]|uniref:LppA family lipoprotein n=1 Tax=Amycolatopsis orientalis TaxID=31958 RepID=UPI00056BAFBE|nr:LppA family lipoprotein [Amycolatopsis orientalis]
MRRFHSPRVPAAITRSVLAFVLLLVSACSSHQAPPAERPGSADAAARELAVLRQRPDITTVVTRYEQLLTALRDALSARLPWGPWHRDNRSRGSARSCDPEFTALDGQRAALPLWYTASDGITHPQWTVARDLVTNMAARQGFRRAGVASDQPGNYTATLLDSTGAVLSFGASRNAVVEVTTGCHLSQQHPAVSP